MRWLVPYANVQKHCGVVVVSAIASDSTNFSSHFNTFGYYVQTSNLACEFVTSLDIVSINFT